MNHEFLSKNIINNMIEVMSIAVQFSSHKDSGTQDLQGSLQYFSGCEFPFFNGVFNNYQYRESGVKDDLIKVTEFFKMKDRPFIWWWTQQSDIPEAVKKELDEQGFQYLGEYLGIAAELEQMELAASDEHVKTICVSTDEQFKDYLAILCDVFQLSASIQQSFAEMFQSYGVNGKFKHYLGYYQDEPVATLTSYINGEIVGLYNGATLAKAQRKGLCSILGQQAIHDAMKSGCKYAISQLMAPGMAKGITEKVGFKKYCILSPFLKDPRGSI